MDDTKQPMPFWVLIAFGLLGCVLVVVGTVVTNPLVLQNEDGSVYTIHRAPGAVMVEGPEGSVTTVTSPQH